MIQKLLVLIILALLAANWIKDKTKGRKISELNLSKESFKKIQKTNEKVLSEKTKRPAKFEQGTCLQKNAKTFNGAKIVNVEPDIYHIQRCVKYKGCTGKINQVSWDQFHRDYAIYKIIKCPKTLPN